MNEEEKIWWLRDHQSASGRREVRQEYDRSHEAVEAAFDVAWEYLEVRPRTEWTRPHAHRMSKFKGYRDFFEIRFFANKLQQRPIGYFGPAKDEFTLLIWATEKGGSLVPQSWDTTSKSRMDSITDRTAQSVPWNEDEIKQTRQTKTQSLPGSVRLIAPGTGSSASDQNAEE